MSSNRQFSLIVFLIIASLIGIAVLFIRKAVVSSCSQSDPQVCRFLNNYRSMSRQSIKGMYTIQKDNDESTHTISWKKDAERRAISVVQDEESILETVILTDYIYLKDYSDNSWWKQKISDTPTNESYLPFDPYNFFKEFDSIVFDAQTTFTRIGEIGCGEEKCIRYKVSSPNQSKDLQRFIYVTSDFNISTILDADNTSSHEIKVSPSTELIVEPETTKIPPVDKNIFLDYLIKRQEEKEKKFEYVKQFQTEREKAEGVPVIESQTEEPESATASAN
jgi:hypothetical protein